MDIFFYTMSILKQQLPHFAHFENKVAVYKPPQTVTHI